MAGIAQGVSLLDQFGAPIGSGNPLPVASSFSSASNAALSSVGASATTVILSAANVGRKGWSVFNDSSAVLYLADAGTASTSAYTTQVPPNSLYEMPLPIYPGAISALWATATGNARITELT